MRMTKERKIAKQSLLELEVVFPRNLTLPKFCRLIELKASFPRKGEESYNAFIKRYAESKQEPREKVPPRTPRKFKSLKVKPHPRQEDIDRLYKGVTLRSM